MTVKHQKASESDAVQEDDRPVEYVHFIDAPPDDEQAETSGTACLVTGARHLTDCECRHAKASSEADEQHG